VLAIEKAKIKNRKTNAESEKVGTWNGKVHIITTSTAL
jgi:hypothetical protein